MILPPSPSLLLLLRLRSSPWDNYKSTLSSPLNVGTLNSLRRTFCPDSPSICRCLLPTENDGCRYFCPAAVNFGSVDFSLDPCFRPVVPEIRHDPPSGGHSQTKTALHSVRGSLALTLTGDCRPLSLFYRMITVLSNGTTDFQTSVPAYGGFSLVNPLFVVHPLAFPLGAHHLPCTVQHS
ncbi:hypothetical protein P170DRAFT_33034 [Aspergillus steynii IBT 23096]|uniref:Uncharacterized protein n=1 Tax=Aspergillus steynii IBT 23096 TaxID=1392250 RepID=A0A2I2GQI9_9EURO|nr:uncharacterized protein P170DRAFT_33034 [Aspergillus steynii IBT 23096]PLB55131.1 hypothetical protein P170DRAFT_33034 [Aspergillus steynii IBT 23096]